MIGLVYKDLLCLRKSAASYLFVVAIYGLLTVAGVWAVSYTHLQDGKKRYVNNLQFNYRIGSSVDTGRAYIDLSVDMTATVQALNDLGILNEYVTLRTCAEHDALYESRYQDGNATVAVYEDSYETDLVPESATESA